MVLSFIKTCTIHTHNFSYNHQREIIFVTNLFDIPSHTHHTYGQEKAYKKNQHQNCQNTCTNEGNCEQFNGLLNFCTIRNLIIFPLLPMTPSSPLSLLFLNTKMHFSKWLQIFRFLYDNNYSKWCWSQPKPYIQLCVIDSILHVYVIYLEFFLNEKSRTPSPSFPAYTHSFVVFDSWTIICIILCGP